MPFVNLGVCPEAASSLLAPQRMGYGRAAEALLLGDPFLAEAALEMGLVSRIVPPAEASALAQRQAQRLATKPFSSVLETKRLMKHSHASEVDQRLIDEAEVFGRMLGEPAAREAFGAFMEKRQPNFSNL
jgi:enoyl-CoA hydratase/carnithine racemase